MSEKRSNSASGNKPKKSKNDFIRSSLGAFLKQKNYAASEKFRKSDFPQVQSKKQFLFNKMIENDLSKGNSFIFSNVLCVTNNHTIVDQQFAKFTKFIELQNEPIKSELHKCIGPLLCHLYLELLKGHEVKAATEFIKKYAHLIAPVESYEATMPNKLNGCAVADASLQDESVLPSMSLNPQIRFATLPQSNTNDEQEYFINLIQILSTCLKLETAESCNDIIMFRSSKYEIQISDDSMKVLNNFLQNQGHVLILRLIYTWIHITIDDIQGSEWSERALFLPNDSDIDHDMTDDVEDQNDEDVEHTDEMLDLNTISIQEDPATSPNQTEQNETEEPQEKKTLQILLDNCMKELRECSAEMQTWPESPRFVRLSEITSNLVTAHIDANECHLAAGFSNGEVKLWQLNQMNCAGKNMYTTFRERICPWEINNTVLESDDEEKFEQETILREQAENSKFYENAYEGNMLSEYGGFILRGHNRGVTDIRFSAHFPILISVSKDKTMRSWRSDSFTCSTIYRGHNYPIWCFDESPVKMYAATGSRDLTARLWSLDREFPLITYVGHTQDVDCIKFHPNGNYIATGSCDLSLRLWCVTSGKLVRVFSDCKLPITSIAFSSDGKFLAAAGEEAKIRIFDLAAGSQITEIKDQSATVTSMQWSPSGKMLATSGADGTLRVWDVSKMSTTSHDSSNISCIQTMNNGWRRMAKVCFGINDTITAVGS